MGTLINNVYFHYKNVSFWLHMNLDVIPQGSHLHFLHPYTSCNMYPYLIFYGDKHLD